jgi:DNA-binding XRE family transcriptional regulator
VTAPELHAARVALGWSAPLLGAIVGLSATTVYHLERGRYAPPRRTLDALTHALGKGNNVSAWTYPPPAELAAFWARRGIV